MFEQYPWFKGTFEPGHIENSYQLFDVPNGGGRWLVIALEFGPRDEVLAWADGIAKQYADTPAMVVTHAYLYDDDTRYDHVARPHQAWNPHGYYDGARRAGSTTARRCGRSWCSATATSASCCPATSSTTASGG